MPNDFNTSEILSALRRDGIVTLERWFTDDNLVQLKREVETLEANPPYWSRISEKKHGTSMHFSPLAARKSGEMEAIRQIETSFNSPQFRELCDAYLGRGWLFDRIICARNFPYDEAIAPWHVDHFQYAERCLKFFIYLTDATPETGAFSYVPGWHNLVRRLSDELPDFAQRQKSLHIFDQVVAASEGLIERLRANGQTQEANEISALLVDARRHIRDADNSDNHYSIAAPAGSVIIFDPAGMHRGGVVQQDHRLIVRSHCLQSKLSRTLSSRNDFLVYANRNATRLTNGRDAFV